MSQGNVRGIQPPNTTTGKSSSDGAIGSSTTKSITARGIIEPVRKTTNFIQKMRKNHAYSMDQSRKKGAGGREDPTVDTMPVGRINYLKNDQPDKSSELQGRREIIPRANITQESPGNCDNTGNIQDLLRNRLRITPEEGEIGTTTEFPLVEEYQKSRGVNNTTTTAVAHSHDPKESSQLTVKTKPQRPPPPSKDKLMNLTQNATVDPSKGTEEYPPKQNPQYFRPEEKKNSTIRDFPLADAHQESRDINTANTSGASQSHEPKESSLQLPEKQKPKLAPKPPPPLSPPSPERVTTRDTILNATLVAIGDTSKETEDNTRKQSLQSFCLEEKEHGTSRKCSSAEVDQKSKDVNNTATSGAAHSHEPKESSQQLLEAKAKSSRRAPPPPPPPPPPVNVTPKEKSSNATPVVIGDKSKGTEDNTPKHSLQSPCTEEKGNSTARNVPLSGAHQESMNINNASINGAAHLTEPKESFQKVPLRAPPPPPTPEVSGSLRDKLTNATPLAKDDRSRTEDGPLKHILESSSHGPKQSSQDLGKTKPPRPSQQPPVKNAAPMAIGGTRRGTEDSRPKQTPQPSLFDASQVLVLSWDLGHEATKVSSYLMGNQNHDCPCVALSPLKKDSEWTSLVDQSSIVVFYTTPKSQKPLQRMGRYLEYCISKIGGEKVIAVIGDADNLKEEWTTKWEENTFSKFQQFKISQAELDWISRKEVSRKIEKIRNSQIFHTGPPTGRMQMSQPTNQKTNVLNNKETKILSEMGTPQTPKQTVGFLSWSSKDDSQWLLKLLRPPYFQDTVEEMIYIDEDKNEQEKIMNQIFKVSSLVLHFTQESFCTFSSQPDFSERLRLYCEKKKIIVVIDDLDGKNSEMTIKELYKKSNMENMSSDLFMFGKMEKEMDYLTHITGDEPDNIEAGKKQKLFQDAISRSMKLPDPPGPKLGTVGIFSRSSQMDYEWLEPLLKSANLGVKEVRPVYISNKGFSGFYEELTRCDFAILYHTKNRGRVNITNVTDSLYDMEIEELSTALGRYKVLVVIDDLQDSSWRTKNRILKFQYSIPKYARNLLLVSEDEKKKGENEGKLLTKLREIIVSPAVDEEGPWETNGHNPETNKPETLTNENDPEALSK